MIYSSSDQLYEKKMKVFSMFQFQKLRYYSKELVNLSVGITGDMTAKEEFQLS